MSTKEITREPIQLGCMGLKYDVVKEEEVEKCPYCGGIVRPVYFPEVHHRDVYFCEECGHMLFLPKVKGK